MNYFQSSWFKVRMHWHYACGCGMHYGASDLVPNIQVSGPYKCPLGWARWALVGNASMKAYLKKDSVTTIVNNRVYLSFYLWLLYFCYSRTITYEGGIFWDRFCHLRSWRLRSMALSFLISLKIMKSLKISIKILKRSWIIFSFLLPINK